VLHPHRDNDGGGGGDDGRGVHGVHGVRGHNAVEHRNIEAAASPILDETCFRSDNTYGIDRMYGMVVGLGSCMADRGRMVRRGRSGS
jgi:hypothetical protein